MHEATAPARGVTRMSCLRCQRSSGTYSHHGRTPTALTTACQPTLAPSVRFDLDAD